MNHSVWSRRIRNKRFALACFIVALVIALLIALETDGGGKATRTAPAAGGSARKAPSADDSAGMAPPSGYSASELIFDDQFSGTSLNYAHWNTFIGGQGNPTWNANGLPTGDSGAGTSVHQVYFSPSQVTVHDGLTLTMVPDTTYSSLGYKYRSGVVTTDGKFAFRGGYVQIKAKMSDASGGGWPAIWFIDPSGGGGDQEIDLQEGGFTPQAVGLPSSTPENSVFVSTYHSPSGPKSGFSYATPTPMDAGFNIYGLEYIPGQSITTYFNGRLVGSWTHGISTTPYEIIIWNTEATANIWRWHTTGQPQGSTELSVAEVQVYALPQ